MGFNFFTPVIVIFVVPSPWIFAPIEIRNSPRSTRSGSRAALSIVVTPSARTAAVIMFSVAPTEGKSSTIAAPFKPCGARATTNPCSMVAVAPRDSRPLICISRGRGPMASPPGNATSACATRATNGPRTLIEARILRTRS
ncbi:unannotated protein [freshwater metagenome]|uniref:Unannotated protein n=1 Tax=freshwater metagenome TaxID=449393 RepID=A0A6J7G7B5_9ZZZZ